MKYHILHIEDSKTDADLVKRIIEKYGIDFSYELASNESEVLAALDSFKPDIILCDHSFPSFNSRMAFQLCKESNPDLTFILVTGTVPDEFAVEMLKAGVDDYLLKTNLLRLPVAIENAYSKRAAERDVEVIRKSLQESETNLRTIFENSESGLILIDRNFIVLELNDRTKTYSKISFGRELKKNENLLDILSVHQRAEMKKSLNKTLHGERIKYESVFPQADGSSLIFSVKLSPTIDEAGIITGVCITFDDISERKRVENELKESELFNRGIYASIDNHIAVVEKNGTIISVNKAWNDFSIQNSETKLESTGVGSNYISVCENAAESGDEIAVNALHGFLQVCNNKSSTFEMEYPCHSNDEIRWFSMRVVPFADDSTKVVVMHIDISELKKLEAERKSLTERLLMATNNASMGIWDWDIQKDQLVWDEGCYKLYDVDPLLFGSVYSQWLIRLHPDDSARVDEDIQLAITGKKPYDTEFRIIWDDKSVHYIRAIGITESDDKGTMVRMFGLNWDITSQKVREHQLNLWESVITNTTDSVVITEAEPFDLPGHRIVYVNDAFTKMTGYSSEEVIGKTTRILQGPKTDRTELKRFRNEIEKWQESELTVVNYKKNGEEYWVNFKVSPVADENGWFTHWISIERDVTAQKLAEIKLIELNENLQKNIKDLATSNADLEQFAYVASHDLQEPLRMITSFLTQLSRKYSGVIDEKGKTYIDFAVDGATRMRQIILDLLEFSRVGGKEEIIESFDPSVLIDEIKILYKRRIEDKKASISIDPMPVINVHRLPVSQVFQNLVSNALKYSRPEVPVQIHISVRDLRDYWEFAVADNGIGIEKEYFEKIFIIFQRLHNRSDFPGTGMGLAIVKKIIEGQGGKIWVDSEEGKGSTFYFTIPKNAS